MQTAVTAIFIIGAVKGLVDAIKVVIPVLGDSAPVLGIPSFRARALAVVLTTALVLNYHFNALAAAGVAGAYPAIDYLLSTITLALGAMGVNDVMNIWGAGGSVGKKAA